jgi:hypothetical protein
MAQWLMASATRIGRPALNLIRALQGAQSRRRARFETRAVRGITLLREWLSTQQRRQFDSYDYFEVVGCDSGKSYRIQHGVCQNVLELDADGRPRMGWCFIPEGNLVPGDVMLNCADEANRWAFDLAQAAFNRKQRRSTRENLHSIGS